MLLCENFKATWIKEYLFDSELVYSRKYGNGMQIYRFLQKKNQKPISEIVKGNVSLNCLCVCTQ